MGRIERERPTPDVNNPYIDLFAAQTAATLAWVLYFMEDKLDKVTPRIGRRVRNEIERRIIQPFRTHDDFWWMGMIRKDMNNWTPWILSNILYTVLILERDEARRCQTTARGWTSPAHPPRRRASKRSAARLRSGTGGGASRQHRA